MAAARPRRGEQATALQCHLCQKSFSKAEHLQRHARSHTGVKPFACPVCRRRFGRSDSLARHGRTHASAHAASPQAPSLGIGASNAVESESTARPSTTPDPGSSSPGLGVIEYDFSYQDLDSLGMALEWPDSEDLLHAIVATNWNSLALPPGRLETTTAPSPILSAPLQPEMEYVNVTAEVEAGIGTDNRLSPNGSHAAIQSLSDMVTDLSQAVTSAVKALPELTPVFLDSCLQAYFAQFNTHFSILHRPTFVFRDCSPSLVLNAIAIGSLYIGTADAVVKGEAIWKLAHTAVATSWQALIRHQGPYDSHKGVQLLLTALLGQCYAMMSKNKALRLTSQVFHALGFQWAAQCDMFTPRSFSNNRQSDKEYQWKSWASREVHRQALLGHYVLDGQLTYLSGYGTSIVHPRNNLGPSASTLAFDARYLEEWLTIAEDHTSTAPSFSQIYKDLFSAGSTNKALDSCLRDVRSRLDCRVILECLHALVRENKDASSIDEASIISIPSLTEVRVALMEVYDLLTGVWRLSHADRLELLLYWHFVSIQALCDTRELADQICRYFRIEQSIFRSGKRVHELQTSLRWARESSDAKRAFLHATAIQMISGELPSNNTHSFWMPLPTFAASIVLHLFRLSGILSIYAPTSVHWWSTIEGRNCYGRGNATEHLMAQKQTKAFLALDIKALSYAVGPLQNILFELGRLHTTIHSSAAQWGLSQDMYDTLEQIRAVEYAIT